uniref:Uncharacterized protein n=1 Tax=Anopheles arabiensis TaxID=7173 RepID=A0A182IG48_ANOAR
RGCVLHARVCVIVAVRKCRECPAPSALFSKRTDVFPLHREPASLQRIEPRVTSPSPKRRKSNDSIVPARTKESAPCKAVDCRHFARSTPLTAAIFVSLK